MKKKISCTKQAQQSLDNVISFLNDEDFIERRIVFFSLVQKFEEYNIKWALACSCNLFLRGLLDDFNDFDIIIDSSSAEKIEQIMSELSGKLIATGGNGCCESDVYLHYQIGHCDIDIISGFRINTFGTSYYYQLVPNEISIFESDYLGKIPLVPLEALFLLYAMMEGWQRRRRFKRELIFEYLLKTKKIQHPQILKRTINTLPKWVQELSLQLL